MRMFEHLATRKFKQKWGVELMYGQKVSTTSSAFASVPNARVIFRLAEEQLMTFEGKATEVSDPRGFVRGQIGVRINGVDYPGSYQEKGFFSFFATVHSVEQIILLEPGLHEAEIVFRSTAESPAVLSISPERPAWLEAWY